MSKVIGVEHFGDSQIANLDHLVLVQENIEGFDVSMEDFIFVDVLESHANLNEKHPDFGFFEILLVLLLEVLGEIATIAVFHDDVEVAIFREGFAVTHNKGVFQLPHYRGFVHCLIY